MVKMYLAKIQNAKNYSEILVRNILSNYLNTDSNKLIICKTRYGKPYLRDYQNIHFNVSHTPLCIVCAISNKPIGVDIEEIKRYNRSIVEQFFTENEKKYVFAIQNKEVIRFTEIWTRKEAYVKWIGKGIKLAFNSFDVLQEKKITSIAYLNYYISICNNELTQIDNHNGFEIEQYIIKSSAMNY